MWVTLSFYHPFILIRARLLGPFRGYGYGLETVTVETCRDLFSLSTKLISTDSHSPSPHTVCSSRDCPFYTSMLMKMPQSYDLTHITVFESVYPYPVLPIPDNREVFLGPYPLAHHLCLSPIVRAVIGESIIVYVYSSLVLQQLVISLPYHFSNGWVHCVHEPQPLSVISQCTESNLA